MWFLSLKDFVVDIVLLVIKILSFWEMLMIEIIGKIFEIGKGKM